MTPAFLFVAGLLVFQGIPVLQNQGGTVTGILRTADGAPAAGVRVSALARPDAIADLKSATSFAGLGETDGAGRYRLEDIPPGRYYIIAGRVDAPTYYPGTVQANEGTVVSIGPGATVSGIDFRLNNASAGRADAAFAGVPGWVIGVHTLIENGGKVPLFAGGKFPVLRFTRSSGARIDVTLDVPNVTLPSDLRILNSPPSATTDYRVTVENLPDGYALKTLQFGAVDLRNGVLQLANNSSVAISSQNISVVLSPPAQQRSAGSRVAGRIRGNAKRSIYISGSPGTIYADGTFEFLGVPPGLHTIVTLDNPGGEHPLGAGLVVGAADLPAIELEDVSVAPSMADRATVPPVGNRQPGTRSHLTSIYGRIVDSETHEPLNAGRIVVNGDYSMTFPLKDDGGFEIPKLLPGNYVVEVNLFGIGAFSRTVHLEEQDAVLEWTTPP